MSSAAAAQILPPINVLFAYKERQAPVTVWLYEQIKSRIEGKVGGFDEFMNVVLTDAVEVNQDTDKRTGLGTILLKGDNITLITSLE